MPRIRSWSARAARAALAPLASLARRVRGAVVLGLVWAAAWGLAAVLLSPYLWTVASVATPRSLDEALSVAGFLGVMWAWFGFLSGAVFSVVLAVAARRRAFHQLTTRRMAAWGVVSSALLTGPPMISMLADRTHGWRADDTLFVGGGLLLSAGCAVASLLLARRATGRREGSPDGLDAGDDAARAFMPGNATLRSGRHAVVVPASYAPESVPIR